MACSNGPHCGACVSEFVAAVGKLGVRRGPDALGDQTRLFRKLCGDFDAFTQLDSVTTTGCVAPQVSHLAALVTALPSACFVLNTRPLAVCESNLQPDFNVRVFECFDASSSAVLRELDESDRFVQKSAESTSM